MLVECELFNIDSLCNNKSIYFYITSVVDIRIYGEICTTILKVLKYKLSCTAELVGLYLRISRTKEV